MLPRPPIVSVITVVYNGARLLEDTIRSVLVQNYPHIEYIIVDGGSTDKTLEVIKLAVEVNAKMLNAKTIRWLSEPDNGIYDAMNKGLKMASGDFVWFLNAGDHFFERETVEKTILQCDPGTDVLFGETMLVNYARRQLGIRSKLTTQKLPETLTWESLRYGMVVCHQSFVVRKNIAPAYIENNLAADIDWVIHCLKKSRKTVNTHLVLTEYLVGGTSKQQHRQSLLDRWKVLKQHYGGLKTFTAHILIFFRAVLHKVFEPA